METVPTSPPKPKYLRVLKVRVLRRRFPEDAPAPCHPRETLMTDRRAPQSVFCPEEGRLFPRAV
jgi:hypothetical protein